MIALNPLPRRSSEPVEFRASYRSLGPAGGFWEGVLRNKSGKIVWSCGHSHKCRDHNHSRLFGSLGAAMYCAQDEIERRRHA